MNQTVGYRRDIDGLRALAITPVVLSHLHAPGFSGGFIGVDIFFVISGYLITGIIAREFDTGLFSLVEFYERRARRILPALFVMIVFVLAVASWLYLPGDFEGVPRSALMTLAFLGNVWFYLNTGYFDGRAETMPLLHCWSLAVEEQFYIAMPLLLWMISRLAPHRRPAIFAALALASFALAWWRQNNFGGTYFFLPVGRAWELLAGALLAVTAVARPQHPWLREGLPLVGLGLIALAITFYDSSTPFPGIATVPPVLGTALLLHLAPGTITGRLLSMRLPVAIGLISYSLYLWHWPLIAFAEYWNVEPLTGILRIVILAIALLAAWVSWRFVERPFRKTNRMSRQRISALSAAGLASLGLISAAMLSLGGWESRFPQEVLRYVATTETKTPCIAAPFGGYHIGCVFGAATTPTSLVWSDSHGIFLAQQLGEELKPQGKALVLQAFNACAPVIDFVRMDYPDCTKFNTSVITHLARTPSINRVYLAAFWADPKYHLPGMIAKVDATISRIRAAGKTVVIVGPVPLQPYNVPRYLAHLVARGEIGQAHGGSAADYARQTLWFTANYPRWQAEGVTILDPARALVAGEYTRIIAGGESLYVDENHLSMAGAKAVLAADPRR
jgi:peptidoglycan/LPS O-acetylase OafA/YrhL